MYGNSWENLVTNKKVVFIAFHPAVDVNFKVFITSSFIEEYFVNAAFEMLLAFFVSVSLSLLVTFSLCDSQQITAAPHLLITLV